jgi:hypothetical protein
MTQHPIKSKDQILKMKKMRAFQVSLGHVACDPMRMFEIILNKKGKLGKLT